jgi:PAS domain S-box-containing protein
VVAIIIQDKRITLEHAADNANTAAYLMSELVAANLRDVANGLLSAKVTLEERGGPARVDPQTLSHILRQQFTYKKAVPLVAAIDARGNLIAHTTDVDIVRRNYRDGGVYRAFAADRNKMGPVVGTPFFGPSHHQWFLPVSVAMRDADGGIALILTAQISVDYLTTVYRSMAHGQQTAIFIGTDSGTLLSRYPYSTEGLGEAGLAPWVAAFAQTAPEKRMDVLPLIDPYDRRERLVGAHRIDDFSLVVFEAADRAEILSPWVERMKERLLILAIAGAILLGAVAWLARTLARQTRSEKLVRALLDVAPDGVFVFREGRVVDCNRRALQMFHLASPREFGHFHPARQSPREQPDGSDSWRRARALSIAAVRGEAQSFEWTHQRRDGSTFEAEICLAGFAVEGDKYLVAFDRDITSRKAVERRIRELNENLESKVSERTEQLSELNARLALANKELEAFTYSASHDLRAPTTLVRGFAQMLAKGRGGTLNDDGRKWVGAIEEAAQRMQDLIDGLLSLSRVGRREIKAEVVDFSAMARQVFAGIRERYPEGFCHFVVADNLQVRADPTLMYVLLENLIGNACKYSSKVSMPLVEIGVSEDEQGPLLFIRDNGAGFDSSKASRLFEPFQRFHAQSDFPGTGIGLATVQRIVARHGGTIRAEAAVGFGATFYFRLPWAIAPV